MKKKLRREVVVATNPSPFFDWREVLMALIVTVVFYGGIIYLDAYGKERQRNIKESGMSHWQQKMEALKVIDKETFVK